ncbi:MAG: methyltransferase domain-containing protein [Myxococcota bacterium]
MDRRTRAIYEAHAAAWIGRREVDAAALRRLRDFADALPERARLADLGCGPGWFAERLRRRGHSVAALDASSAMLRAARRAAPRVPLVRGDLARLPFASGSLDGAWAKNSYLHLPFRELAPALAELHRALRPGGRVTLSLLDFERAVPSARERARGIAQRRSRGERGLDGRLFSVPAPGLLRDLFAGAGFRAISVEAAERTWVRATRARGLPDSIRPGLRLLVVGLNPSPIAAANGVAFAGANNRFWSAAKRAGWIERERDRDAALRRGIGFTDLVKRVTASASALRPREYRRGIERVARLVRVHRPRAVVFVGLEGFRRAVDPSAQPGVLRGGFAGRPAYLTPSTSGRNAATSLDSLVRHLRRALALAH